MGKRIIAGLCGLVLLAAPVSAEVVYDGAGRAHLDGTYGGPGLGMEDLVFLGAAGAGLALAAATTGTGPVHAVAPGALIAWGAWRTARLRPEDAKDRMHAAQQARAGVPASGTVEEVVAE